MLGLEPEAHVAYIREWTKRQALNLNDDLLDQFLEVTVSDVEGETFRKWQYARILRKLVLAGLNSKYAIMKLPT